MGSERSGTWDSGGLVRCSLLAKDMPGDIYLSLTNNTAKLPKLNEL